MKKKYGIDLDGVCFDFKGDFLAWLNHNLHLHLEDEEITSYYWHENSEDMSEQEFWHEFHRFGQEGHGYRSLPLLDGALEGLRAIHEAGHEIYYVTNRPEYALEDTISSLEEHGFPQRENLIFAKGRKSPVIQEKGIDVFIDDSPRTLEEITTNTRATVYCRHYKYNSHLDESFLTRVSGWQEFLEAEEFDVSRK